MATAIECTESEFITYAAWIRQQRCFASFDDNREAHADWLVVPHQYCPNVATVLDESNWSALTRMLEEADPAGETYELQRFGHWATPYQQYIVAPNSAAHKAAAEAICALSDYPVLDDSDYSERECEAQYENVLSEVSRLTFERNGETLDADAEGDLASQICQLATCNEQDDADFVVALEKLGWVLCDDDTWRPESETEPVESDESSSDN